jgi:hypothetical protein
VTRHIVVTATVAVLGVLGLVVRPDGVIAVTSAHSDQFHQSIWHQAQTLIRRDHVAVPWDGKFSYNEKTELCIEVFNGTRHDITWHHAVPSGFYLKICADGEYFVNDATPFPHLQTY